MADVRHSTRLGLVFLEDDVKGEGVVTLLALTPHDAIELGHKLIESAKAVDDMFPSVPAPARRA